MGKTFKFKDLMVNVGPIDRVPLCLCATQSPSLCVCLSHVGTLCHCISHPLTCQGCSIAVSCLCASHQPSIYCDCASHAGTFCNCSILLSRCDCITNQPSLQCVPGTFGPGGDPLGDPEQLAALKQQLKQVLADVEKQEQAVTESLRPQTVAEADELQQKLQGALEELKGLRAELARKEKEGKQSGN